MVVVYDNGQSYNFRFPLPNFNLTTSAPVYESYILSLPFPVKPLKIVLVGYVSHGAEKPTGSAFERMRD